MGLCAGVLAQRFKRFLAAFVCDQISNIFEQDQFERIRRDWRLRFAVMRREERDELR